MKANPLFVDSTKLYGGCIGTQFELNRLLIYDDETLAVLVTNHDGKTVRIPMPFCDESTYAANVMLSHQKPITYQFVIEKNGQVIFKSLAFQSRAQHAIVEDWQPVESETLLPPIYEPAALAPTASASPPASPVTDVRAAADYAMSIKALIEKWDL